MIRARHPIPVHLRSIIVHILYFYTTQILAVEQFIYKDNGIPRLFVLFFEIISVPLFFYLEIKVKMNEY